MKITSFGSGQAQWCVISTPFPFHFLVHLHFNLLSSLPAIFVTRIATEVISQIIECYQFSCHLAVPEKKSWTPKGVDSKDYGCEHSILRCKWTRKYTGKGILRWNFP